MSYNEGPALDKFNRAVTALAGVAPSQGETAKVIHGIFGRVMKNAASRTVKAKPTSIERRADFWAARKNRSLRVAGASAVLSTAKADGFVWNGVEVLSDPRKDYESKSEDFWVRIQGKVYSTRWKHPPERWAVIVAACGAQKTTFIEKRRKAIEDGKKARGLNARPYAQAAAEIEKKAAFEKGFNAAQEFPSYIRNATDYKGNAHTDKTSTTLVGTGSQLKIGMETSSTSTTRQPEALEKAVSGWTKGVETAIKKAVSDDLTPVVKKFTGVELKT